MILVPVSAQHLLALIEAEKPGWLVDAAAQTSAAIAAGKVGKDEGIWSAIKGVYIRLQEHKCAYCETPMPKIEADSTEGIGVAYDVEHFRPKNRVKAWPSAKVKKRRSIDYAASVKQGVAAGYVRLAFDPANYVVACKVCNSSYKADRFPIAGSADATSVTRAALDAAERPLLLLPFGDDGDDPEHDLEWDGASVRARAPAGQPSLRGRTVVDFFELDTREDLLFGRAMGIAITFEHLERRAHGSAAERARAETYLDAIASELRFPHLACLRAFVALHAADPARALQWRDAAQAYLVSRDRAVFPASVAPV